MVIPSCVRTRAHARTYTLLGFLLHLCLQLLSQSRTAARKELLDQASTPDECEKLYEESLWCLYTLQDDLLQADNPFAEEDRATIGTCE
jgi:hypothetical protein